MRFAWVHKHRAVWPIARICRALRVTRSGYYAWRQRPVSATAARRAELVGRIRAVHASSRRTYGSPRVHRELRSRGVRCNVKTVAKLMRDHRIRSRIKRRFKPMTTASGHRLRVADNVLDRRFDPGSTDTAWVCDITYVPTRSGWLYLAVVLDVGSRAVRGYAMADHLKASLPIDALTMAIDRRKRSGASLEGLVHHCDRGVQYACDAYRTLLAAHHITPSMSRRGNCYDNAVAESFFGTLKQELVHHEDYATHAQAEASITDYIDHFYNPIRRHSALGYFSPLEFETMIA